jgi:biopolymer transport protein ExbD
MVINFSEVLIRRVNLPKADEAKVSKEQIIKKIPITVKSGDLIFLGSKKVSLDTLKQELREKVLFPQRSTVQLRGDENTPYHVVQKLMQTIASLGITRIEFSARREAVTPLEKDISDETSDQIHK